MTIFKRITSFFADTIQTIVLAGAIFAIIYLFLFQPHQVVGDSMLPNFHNGEYLLTDKVSYRIREPERGEVIVFKAPNDPEKDYIKRIVAEPGETIKIEKGIIFVNEMRIDENSYLSGETRTFAGQNIREGIEYKAPEGSYFVFGDNRGNSSDSREWGFIKKDAIIGRSFLVYWPLSKFRLVTPGKVF